MSREELYKQLVESYRSKYPGVLWVEDTEAELRATVEVLTQKNIELQKELREMRGDLKPGEMVKVISEFTNAEREQALGLMTPEQLDRIWPIGETVTLHR